jgi:hypothetical protein
MVKMLPSCPTFWAIILLLTVIGCSGPDDRVVEVTREAAARQAEQNAIIARQTQQLTEMSANFLEAEERSRQELIALQQDIVERDAECRQELATLHRETQAAVSGQRKEVDRQRDLLEAERKELAEQRHRAPLVAAAITQAGLLVACLAPLVLCGWLIYSLRHGGEDHTGVVQLMVDELVTQSPDRLLPAPPTGERTKALPNTDAEPASTADTIDEG